MPNQLTREWLERMDAMLGSGQINLLELIQDAAIATSALLPERAQGHPTPRELLSKLVADDALWANVDAEILPIVRERARMRGLTDPIPTGG